LCTLQQIYNSPFGFQDIKNENTKVPTDAARKLKAAEPVKLMVIVQPNGTILVPNGNSILKDKITMDVKPLI